MGGRIPDRWDDYSDFGSAIQIGGAPFRFIPGKVPLSREFNRSFSTENMIRDMKEHRLLAVINLCATRRYYEFAEFEDFDIPCFWVPVEGGGHVPPPKNFNAFLGLFHVLCNQHRDSKEQGVVYIHCTHGVNRTGLFLCALMLSLGCSPEDCLTTFSKTRGHGIDKQPFIDAVTSPHFRSTLPNLIMDVCRIFPIPKPLEWYEDPVVKEYPGFLLSQLTARGGPLQKRETATDSIVGCLQSLSVDFSSLRALKCVLQCEKVLPESGISVEPFDMKKLIVCGVEDSFLMENNNDRKMSGNLKEAFVTTIPVMFTINEETGKCHVIETRPFFESCQKPEILIHRVRTHHPLRQKSLERDYENHKEIPPVWFHNGRQISERRHMSPERRHDERKRSLIRTPQRSSLPRRNHYHKRDEYEDIYQRKRPCHRFQTVDVFKHTF